MVSIEIDCRVINEMTIVGKERDDSTEKSAVKFDITERDQVESASERQLLESVRFHPAGD